MLEADPSQIGDRPKIAGQQLALFILRSSILERLSESLLRKPVSKLFQSSFIFFPKQGLSKKYFEGPSFSEN